VTNEVAAIAVDGGDLPLGGGLLSLVRPALNALGPGGTLAVLSRSRSVNEDLPSWCRAEAHEYLGVEEISPGLNRHLISRRSKFPFLDVIEPTSFPDRAEPFTGFAPRGSRVERGGPPYPFTLNERDRVAPPEVIKLYEQAVVAQWDATTDVPWSKVKRLPSGLDRAVAQVMSFLAENELSALYVPSRFVAHIHPHFAEVAMFLATQLADEARHIDVFLKRVRLCAEGTAISSVITSRSLLSLLQIDDFTEATFLLSVLGEGTFLDLLSFIERHAPDEATYELTRRAKNDETRHVHFGLAHVRFALANDQSLYGRLEAAVRRRSATLHGAGGVPAPLQDALTILAAGGTEPEDVARGHESYRELLETMHISRIKRLGHAGFTAEQAETLSRLHTPNFM
jgi:TusA-related sulfurtransferase